MKEIVMNVLSKTTVWMINVHGWNNRKKVYSNLTQGRKVDMKKNCIKCGGEITDEGHIFVNINNKEDFYHYCDECYIQGCEEEEE
jgi:hypothetical protein